ncbi:DNA cytosine methyltransferase [Archangium sp.]|uniref:DNA cytosine methyltransferase n=1 Tax=Archangium sp. TaxID=1872627 RepID=UPI00389A8FD8
MPIVLRQSQSQSERRAGGQETRAREHQLNLLDSSPQEEYGVEGEWLWRRVLTGSKLGPKLAVPIRKPVPKKQDALRAAWDRELLQGWDPEPLDPVGSPRSLRVVDLFAGCGAMSLGVKWAAKALGYEFEALLAADSNTDTFEVYEQNLKPRDTFKEDLSKVVAFEYGDLEAGEFLRTPELRVPAFQALVDNVDLLIGGPPCQGHSNLNNHSRRDDPKNALYLLMPALAVSLRPKAIIIENVRAVIHDKLQVVQRTKRLLEKDYDIDEAVVSASEMGIPQSRRRHILIAVRKQGEINGMKLRLNDVVQSLRTRPRTVKWAISDLCTKSFRSSDAIFDAPSTLSAENQKRVDWLFTNKQHDLPNFLRPSCHKDKQHSYTSMYGRMKWGEPAQTITSGFGSPGQGRFIHPKRRRLITPHEAARLQFFPDFFKFTGKKGNLKRTRLTEMIGNAVPPKLAYVVGLAVLGNFP